MRLTSFLLTTLLIVVLGRTAVSQSTFSGTGNWSTPGNWSAGVPTSAVAATIASGANCTVDVAAQCASLTFAAINASSVVTISGANSITITGAITMPRPAAGLTGTVNINAGSISCASIALSATTTPRNDVINITTGTLTVSGNITSSGAGSQLIFSGAGTLNAGGTFMSGTTGTFTCSTSTVNFNGAAQAIAPFAYTFNNVTLSGSGAKTLTNATIGGNLVLTSGSTVTVTTAAALAVGGSLTVGDGTTLTAGAFALTVTGTTTVGSGVGSTATLTTNSATGTKTFTGAVTINSNGVLSETAAATLSFGSDVTINGTLTESGAATVGIAGNLMNNGTYTASTGVHTFSGAAKTFSGSSTNSIPRVTVSGSYTNNGTLTIGTALAGAGSLANASTCTLNIGGSCSITTFTNSGTTTVSGAGNISTAVANFTNADTLNLGGSGTITGITNNGIVNLTTSGTITSFNNATAASILNISDLAVPTFTTLTVSTAGNTVNYSGAGAQTVKVVAYSNLILSGSGAKTFAVTTVNNNLTLSGTATATTGAALTIGGALTVGTGTTFATGATNTWTLGVTGTTSVTGTLNLANTGTKTFTGDVTINAGGTWNETGAAAYSIAGNFTNNATAFTANTGVHTFSGAAKTFSGSTTTSIPSVTVSGSYTNNGILTVSTALAGAGSLANSANNTLNIGGNCSITTFANGGTTTVSGVGIISTAVANFTNTDTLNLNGSGAITGITNNAAGIVNLTTSGTITSFNNATSTSTLNISDLAVPTFTTLTVTTVGNTVNYKGAGAQTVKAVAYSNLTLSGSGAKTTTGVTVNKILNMAGTATASVAPTYGASATLQYDQTATAGPEWITPFLATGGVVINSGTVTLSAPKVLGNNTSVPLNIISGATLTPRTNLLTFDGDFINAGTLTSGSGGVTITGTVAAQSIDGFTTTGAVSMTKTAGTATLTDNVNGGAFTLNGSGGTLDLGAGFTHTFTGAWTFSNGTLLGNSSTLNIGGATSYTAGTFTPGTSTVNYNGTGAQTILAFNYYNLTVSGVRTNNVTLASTGTIGIANTFNPSATFTSGAFVNTGSTVDYNGTGAQSIVAFNYNNLTISQARTSNNVTLATSGTIGIAGTFNPSATFTGGAFDNTGSTIDYNGTGAQMIVAFSYNNLTVSQARTSNNVTLANSGTIDIAGTFNPSATFTGGSFVNTGSTVEYDGSGSQNIPAFTYNNLTLTNGGATAKNFAGTDSVTGDLLINASATGAGGSATIALFGNWTNSGTFSAGTSTVVLGNSAAVSITGATTFNSLTVNKLASTTVVTLNHSIGVGTLTMTQGTMQTGANSVTITSARSGNGLILGTVTQTLTFSLSTPYAFEGPNTLITFTGGSLPTSVTITVLAQTTPSSPTMIPVDRSISISSTGGSFTATLRLHYENSETNSLNETLLKLWMDSSGTWVNEGATSRDSVNNYVELTGVTAFGTWAIGASASSKAFVDNNGGSTNAGDTLTYTVTAVNPYVITKSTINVSDALSSNFILVPGTISNSGGIAGQTLTGMNLEGGTITWPSFSLTAGASATRTFQLRSDSSISSLQTITNTAHIDFGGGRVEYVSVPVTFTNLPSVSIANAVDNSSPIPGDILTYTLSVTNKGTSNATSITLNTAIPNNTTFSNDSYGVGMGVEINGVPKTNASDGDGVTVGGGSITVTITALASGATTQITFKTTVN